VEIALAFHVVTKIPPYDDYAECFRLLKDPATAFYFLDLTVSEGLFHLPCTYTYTHAPTSQSQSLAYSQPGPMITGCLEVYTRFPFAPKKILG
jgi:hypothetical protein